MAGHAPALDAAAGRLCSAVGDIGAAAQGGMCTAAIAGIGGAGAAASRPSCCRRCRRGCPPRANGPSAMAPLIELSTASLPLLASAVSSLPPPPAPQTTLPSSLLPLLLLRLLTAGFKRAAAVAAPGGGMWPTSRGGTAGRAAPLP